MSRGDSLFHMTEIANFIYAQSRKVNNKYIE